MDDTKPTHTHTNSRGLAARLRAGTTHLESKQTENNIIDNNCNNTPLSSTPDTSNLCPSDLFPSQLSQLFDDTTSFNTIYDGASSTIKTDPLPPIQPNLIDIENHIYNLNPTPTTSTINEELNETKPYDLFSQVSLDEQQSADIQSFVNRIFPPGETHPEENITNSATIYVTKTNFDSTRHSFDTNEDLATPQNTHTKNPKFSEPPKPTNPKQSIKSSECDYKNNNTLYFPMKPSIFSPRTFKLFLNEKKKNTYSPVELQQKCDQVEAHLATLLPFKPSAPFNDDLTYDENQDIFHLYYKELRTRLPGLPDSVLYMIGKRIKSLALKDHNPKARKLR